MKNKIIVTGSLAYDRIMNFKGSFKDHILPNKIHMLNVCFSIKKLEENFGGTAGNIAYNLSLLGEKPIVYGTAGKDFKKYKKWMKKQKINCSKIKIKKRHLTSSAHIVTDEDNNQITAFYSIPKDVNYCKKIQKIKNIKMAIISPETKEHMLTYARIYKKNKIPYILDPGQEIPNFSKKELKELIKNSEILIVNDYESQLIMNILKINKKDFIKLTKNLIITKGAKGSYIYRDGKKIFVKNSKCKKVVEPTGAGDAYRAGLIKGILNNWSLKKSAKLGSVVATYAISKYGTQKHKFTKKQIRNKFKRDYKEKIEI